MTTAIGRGVRLEYATTFGAAKNVTAVTLASPGMWMRDPKLTA